MKFSAVNDKVVLTLVEAEGVSSGGILLPDQAKEKPQQGVVVSVGPGLENKPPVCKEGNRVLFSRYGGSEVTIDGEKFTIVSSDSIYLVFDAEPSSSTVCVNGKEFLVEGTTLSYEDVLELAVRKPGATVVYHVRTDKDSHRSGTLYKGKSVEICDGMDFSVAYTGNA